MTHEAPRFLPDRLRPQRPGRRSRRGLVLLSVVPFMLLAFPFWKIAEVRVDGCPRLPRPAVESLEALVGQPALGLDVAGVKERVEIWPGVGEVQVDFLLPGTVIVRAKDAEAQGSVRVGRSWHGESTSLCNPFSRDFRRQPTEDSGSTRRFGFGRPPAPGS